MFFFLGEVVCLRLILHKTETPITTILPIIVVPITVKKDDILNLRTNLGLLKNQCLEGVPADWGESLYT